MKTQEITVRIIEAEEGKELYRISEPKIYGKKIALGINDSPDNWAERDETIEQPIVDNINTEIGREE